MKIVIDARLYGLENAGLGRYAMNLIHELSQLDTKNQYTLLVREKYYQKLDLPSSFEQILCDIPHYSLKEQRNLPKVITSLNADIVHFPHFNVPYRFKLPYVVTIHDLLMHKFSGRATTTQPWYKYAIKRFGYKKIFASSVRNATKIIVPTEYVKEDLVRYYPIQSNKVVVTYEGVDIKASKVSESVDVLKKYDINHPFFIYAGNAYPHKNLRRAIEAVVQLNKSTKSPVLFVISCARSVFTSRLEKMIDEIGASEFVKFAGFVPDQDLNILMKKSLGFLYPSLEEGFGLQGLEAMANGTLLVASDIPVFKEVYKDNALYFNPFDYTSIVGQLKIATEMDLDTRRERIKKAKEHAKQFSWRKMAQETIVVYEEAVS